MIVVQDIRISQKSLYIWNQGIILDAGVMDNEYKLDRSPFKTVLGILKNLYLIGEVDPLYAFACVHRHLF